MVIHNRLLDFWLLSLNNIFFSSIYHQRVIFWLVYAFVYFWCYSINPFFFIESMCIHHFLMLWHIIWWLVALFFFGERRIYIIFKQDHLGSICRFFIIKHNLICNLFLSLSVSILWNVPSYDNILKE